MKIVHGVKFESSPLFIRQADVLLQDLTKSWSHGIRDSGREFSNQSNIWQAPQRGLKTSQDLAIRHLTT